MLSVKITACAWQLAVLCSDGKSPVRRPVIMKPYLRQFDGASANISDAEVVGCDSGFGQVPAASSERAETLDGGGIDRGLLTTSAGARSRAYDAATEC